jgi:hypothetical protein
MHFYTIFKAREESNGFIYLCHFNLLLLVGLAIFLNRRFSIKQRSGIRNLIEGQELERNYK